jgi:hypothetical protein
MNGSRRKRKNIQRQTREWRAATRPAAAQPLLSLTEHAGKKEFSTDDAKNPFFQNHPTLQLLSSNPVSKVHLLVHSFCSCFFFAEIALSLASSL